MFQRLLMSAAVVLSVLLAAAEPGEAGEVREERVAFESGGQTLVGVLFLPADATDRLPAVVVAPPWLNVKEQVAARHARELAERGLAALAFDYRCWGESGGEPRELESASAKIEDLRVAVRYMQTRSEAAPGGVGVLGVCFGAGHALTAAAGNPDVKSVATVAAWLHDRPSLVATFGQEEIDRRYRVAAEAKAAFDATGETRYVPAASNTDRTAGMFSPDPAFFYTNPTRGAVPTWTNRMAVMSWTEWLDLDGLAAAAELTQPLLIVHSDGSALPDNARKAFAAAKGPKDLYWTEGDHLDFYDRDAYVAKAADAVAAHFRRTLIAGPAADATLDARP